MQCLVIYDIPDDRIRGKVADRCLDYGLERIQYSAFLGNLSRTHRTELYRVLERILGKARGEIRIIPLDEHSYAASRRVGSARVAGGKG